VLGFVPAGAEAELEAAVGDVVDGCRLLRQQIRVAKRIAADEDPDPDPRGLGGESGEERPGLVVGPGGAARLEVVVAVPDGVEAELIEEPPALDQLGPGQVLVGAEAEAERQRKSSVAPGLGSEQLAGSSGAGNRGGAARIREVALPPPLAFTGCQRC
jgi:hypothetical protein